MNLASSSINRITAGKSSCRILARLVWKPRIAITGASSTSTSLSQVPTRSCFSVSTAYSIPRRDAEEIRTSFARTEMEYASGDGASANSPQSRRPAPLPERPKRRRNSSATGSASGVSTSVKSARSICSFPVYRKFAGSGITCTASSFRVRNPGRFSMITPVYLRYLRAFAPMSLRLKQSAKWIFSTPLYALAMAS